MESGRDAERRTRRPVAWIAIFVAVAVIAFAGSIESGRPVWRSSWLALAAAFLVVAGLFVLDVTVGRRGVRVVAHVLLGLFVLFLAALLSALQFADRFLTAPGYVALAGLWIVGLALLVCGIFVSRDATRRVRRVATVGLGVSLVLGVGALGYAVVGTLSRGIDLSAGVPAEAVAAWALLVVLVAAPSLVFLWDLRETSTEVRAER